MRACLAVSYLYAQIKSLRRCVSSRGPSRRCTPLASALKEGKIIICSCCAGWRNAWAAHKGRDVQVWQFCIRAAHAAFCLILMLFRCSDTPRMVSSLNPARVCVLSSLARTFRSCSCSCSTSHTGVHRDGPPFAYGCHCVLLLNSVSCRCSETPGMKRRLFCCVIVFCIFIWEASSSCSTCSCSAPTSGRVSILCVLVMFALDSTPYLLWCCACVW